MADLIIIAYDTEATAEAARKKLLELQKEYLIELGDAVVAVRQPDGHVKLNQLINTTAAGAASGGMWGALIGLLFLNPLLGKAPVDAARQSPMPTTLSSSVGGHWSGRRR